MKASHGARARLTMVLAAVTMTIVVASCSERIEAGASCPLLCPTAAPPLQDTIIDAVVMDTSIAGYPSLGTETNLILARRGDTLETRVVVRYDSLASPFPDSANFNVDTAYIRGLKALDDSAIALKDSATIEVYDVSDAVNDTAASSLLPLFTPANLLGARRYGGGDKIDTLLIGLDTTKVRTRIANSRRLRVSLRMVTPGSEQLRLVSNEGGSPIQLAIRTVHDTSAPVLIAPSSGSPAIVPSAASTLSDFTFVAASKPLPSGNILRVGGFPWRRVLFRFNIPVRIVDSSAVLRATLMLTQSPMRTGTDAGDTVTVHAVPLVGSNVLTNPASLLEFAGAPGTFSTSALPLTPKDSIVAPFDVVTMVRAWRLQDTIKTPRAIALVIGSEGQRLPAVDFYSIEAPASLRPRLRITYVTEVSSGRP